jgi:hypothetical protein
MPTFKDTNGREWLVTINVAQVRRVREKLSVNLADVHTDAVLAKLQDPVTLVDVLFVLIESQAHERHISDEDFAAGLGGDALETACAALLEALCDFFPKAKRLILHKVLAETTRRQQVAIERLENQVDELIQKALDQAAADNLLTSAIGG